MPVTDEENLKRLEELGIQYRFQCFQEKNPTGCDLLGLFLANVKRDYEKASKVFYSNCEDNKFGASCWNYGNLVITGKLGKSDLHGGMKYNIRGCDYGYGPACYNAGLYHSSAKLIDQQDFPRAEAEFKTACEKGHAMGCFFLSGMYINGQGTVEKNMSKALEFSKKACELESWQACANVSVMYKKGEGVPKDMSLFEKFKEKAELLAKEQGAVIGGS